MSTKRERKLQDRINRISNLTPGPKRIWQLHRFAMEYEAEADRLEKAGPDGLDPQGHRAKSYRDDALFLRRLEWDLMELVIEVRGPVQGRGSAKYDDSQWGRGPRP